VELIDKKNKTMDSLLQIFENCRKNAMFSFVNALRALMFIKESGDYTDKKKYSSRLLKIFKEDGFKEPWKLDFKSWLYAAT